MMYNYKAIPVDVVNVIVLNAFSHAMDILQIK